MWPGHQVLCPAVGGSRVKCGERRKWQEAKHHQHNFHVGFVPRKPLPLFVWAEGDGTARGLWLSAHLAKPEKPGHPTKIKGGILFIITILCLSGLCCFCCMGILLLIFFFSFPPCFFPTQTGYSKINFWFSSSSFSFLSSVFFSPTKLVTAK